MSPLGGSPNGSRLVLILGALSAFGPLSLDLYLPSLPSLARDLHTTTAASALTLTACLIGLAVGQLLSGPLSDQLGRRRPVIVGVAVYAAASVPCMIAPNVWTLVGFERHHWSHASAVRGSVARIATASCVWTGESDHR